MMVPTFIIFSHVLHKNGCTASKDWSEYTTCFILKVAWIHFFVVVGVFQTFIKTVIKKDQVLEFSEARKIFLRSIYR